MFLKRITLSGFKSFPDRADFDFNPGITCIVGPNGCGKSNLVDAFLWVLGEQSPRTLRGRQMTDMIFAGSSARRSSSVAQVDLTFDNADRALAVEQDEVTVTRKLYRSGESEYIINNEPSRLKDIRELFMDTGVGVEAYSIVEQGRVDTLLRSNPAERRVIFEEAAGISKYKARRKEAERKLDRTNQNLLRVADVIDEIEKRLRSVKLQAGKARSYKEYETRLNELRSSYAMAEYHRLTEDLLRVSRAVEQHSDRITAIRTEIDRHESKGAELAPQIDRLNEDINAADSAFIQAKSQLLSQEERVEAARRRGEELQTLRERAVERLNGDQERKSQCEASRRALTDSARHIEEQHRTLSEQRDALQERDRTLARELTDAQATLEDEKTGIVDLLRKSARLHNEITRLNTHRESLVDRKGRLFSRDAQITGELECSLSQKAQLERRVAELDCVIAEEKQQLEEKKAAAARATEMRDDLAAEHANAKERRSALASRREVLEDLHRRMEGVGAAARQILDRKKQPDAPAFLNSVEGLVADLLDVDVEHVEIIEAALGETARAVVVSDSRAFLAEHGALGELPGRLDVLCLDRLPPIVNSRSFTAEPGVVARAIDFVRYAEECAHLARHLLERTVVVDSLDAAIRLSSADTFGHRFVTVHGELVQPDGHVLVGRASSGVGLLSRKSELQEIEGRQVQIGERIETLADRLNRASAELQHLESVQQELRTAIYEANTAKVEANTSLQAISEGVRRLTNEQPLIAQEAALLEQEINEVLEKSAADGQSLEAIECENKRRETTIAEHQARIDGIVVTRREVQDELTQTRVGVAQLNEKRLAAADSIESLNAAIRELDSSIESTSHDVQSCEQRIDEARHVAEAGMQEHKALTVRISELESRCSALRQQRDQLRQDAESLGHLIKDARIELEAAETSLHEQEMALAGMNVRRDDLVSRVADELGIDLPERHQQYEYEVQDWEQVESEISELRKKMERLGNVNLDAIDELEELERRHAFLADQRNDLSESHRQLQQLIERLNRESRERFQENFELIRDNFRTLFRKLFGGGKADIVLENPEDVLESGIEILAQPPGKDLQAITLMSGGEKSLTAIALLMSIFSIRPAPFAIMDEVDAALDEANNERFNRIVKEFVSRSQFLVITHSKWTMNMADRLYGITMQEPGVSTRVSVEFAGANVA